MPLYVGSAVPIVQAPDLPGDAEGTRAPRQGPGNITATWTDADGQLWPLTLSLPESSWFTTYGIGGWGSVPIELVTDPNARGGERVRYIRAKPRVIQWPLYIGGTDHMSFVSNYRRLMRAFTKSTQRKVPGTLSVARPDGTERRISAYYQQGFEGEPGENWISARPVVSLFCPDGYWAESQVRNVVRNFDVSTQASFLNPFFTISSSTVVNDQAGAALTRIDNDGDVDAWPTWTLTGPFDAFEATNTTTGQRFRFSFTITAGRTVVITTSPMTARYYTSSVAAPQTVSRYIDWFNQLGTSLWPLVPGTNQIDFQVIGAGAGTSVNLSWRQRYESA